MTEGVTKTQGTRLYFCQDGSEIHKVACPTGITGLGGARPQISKTCLDSTEQEYEGGMPDPGEVTVPVNFISRSAAHQALADLFESGESVSWMIVESNQSGAPASVDSDSRLVSPGATTKEFLGHIANLTFDYQTNEIVRATLTIQRSGAVVNDFPVADLS